MSQPLSVPLQKPLKVFNSGQHKAKQTEGPGGQACVEGFAGQESHCLQCKGNPHQVGPTGQQGSTCHSRLSINVWPRSALQNKRTGKQGPCRIRKCLGIRRFPLFEHMDRHKAQKLWSEPRRYRKPSAHLHSWSMSHQKSQHSWQLTAVALNLCFGGVYYKRQKRTDLDLMPPQPQISYRNLLKWLNPKGSFTCNQTAKVQQQWMLQRSVMCKIS